MVSDILKNNIFFAKIRKFFADYGKRIGEVALGQTLRTTKDWIIDNPIYIFVVAKEGIIVGGAIMMLVVLVDNFLMISFHGWSKTDWFGFSAIHELRENGHRWSERARNIHIKNRVIRLVVRFFLYIPVKFFDAVIWFLHKGDVVAFFVLNMVEDTFFTTTYLRHGARGKLTKREWKIFYAGIVFSSMFWTIRSFAIFEILKFVWNFFHNLTMASIANHF